MTGKSGLIATRLATVSSCLCLSGEGGGGLTLRLGEVDGRCSRLWACLYEFHIKVSHTPQIHFIFAVMK